MRALGLILFLLTNSITPSAPINPNNAKNLKLVGQIEFQSWELVMKAGWSPDGETLAVSSGDSIRLYEFPRLNHRWTLDAGAMSHSFDFDPSGNWLAVGSRDGSIRIWDLEKFNRTNISGPQPDIVIAAHRKGVNEVIFHPEGELIASGGNDAVARIWHMTTGEVKHTMIGGTLTVPSVVFIDQGETLAVANGDVIRMRSVENEGILSSFRSEFPIYCIQIGPTGKLLAAGTLENTILLWDPNTGFRTGVEEYPEPEVLSGHRGLEDSFESIIWDIDFHPSGDLIASAGGDGSIIVWDTERKVDLMILDGHNLGATSVEFHPNGELLVSGGLDGTVKIWGVVD